MLVSGAVFCRGDRAVVCDTGRTLSLLAVMSEVYVSGVGGAILNDCGLVPGAIGLVGLCICIILCADS